MKAVPSHSSDRRTASFSDVSMSQSSRSASYEHERRRPQVSCRNSSPLEGDNSRAFIRGRGDCCERNEWEATGQPGFQKRERRQRWRVILPGSLYRMLHHHHRRHSLEGKGSRKRRHVACFFVVVVVLLSFWFVFLAASLLFSFVRAEQSVPSRRRPRSHFVCRGRCRLARASDCRRN